MTATAASPRGPRARYDARFPTTRSWLSQWSLDHAQVDAVEAAPRISVPALVQVNSADDACPPFHLRDFFDALGTRAKVLHEIKGANHYFSGADQRVHLDEAADAFFAWSAENGLLAG